MHDSMIALANLHQKLERNGKADIKSYINIRTRANITSNNILLIVKITNC